MPKLDICFTPELLHLYQTEGRIVVVVDILRATSTIVTALQHGAKCIIPVEKVEDCRNYKKNGYIIAAERDGVTAEGFDLGNSPFSYMGENIKNKTIALTTTNGTLAIEKSKNADEIVIGSFLNKKAVANYLMAQNKDVLIVCAGWKGKFNLEDTIFAGALTSYLKDDFTLENDSVLASLWLQKHTMVNLKQYLLQSSHVQRLNNLNIQDDFEFCLQKNIYNIVPVLNEDFEIVSKKVLSN
jgi:2-phosphosulfolactate phosphatase